MQLKKKRQRKLRHTLLASSCALLGGTGAAHAADGDWSLDSGLLYYTEADGVRVLEPVVLAKRDFGDDRSLKLDFQVDSVTGATPTGAMPSSTANTVTGPSGSSGSTQTTGVTPKADFHDLRRAISATWSQPFAEDWHWDAGATYSIEYDFRSLGANTQLSRDFDRRNTTVSAGFAYEHDDVDPIGGVPRPLSTTPQASPVAPDAIKTVKSVLLGVSQVMSHDWLAQLNFSYGDSHGYMDDPYKVVSILNTHLGGAGALPGFPGGPGGGFGPPIGEPIAQIYENRPGARHERALFLRNKVFLAGDVVDLSYRYSSDDWGIHSNTVELRYRWALKSGWSVQPHLRWYRQSAADFYRRGLLDSDTIPVYVSADYRLAAFTARTVGVEFGTRLAGGGELSFRVEHYAQGGGSDPHVVIGVQQGYGLFPGLSANIVQVDYRF
jgi:hypothetical protein